METGLLNPDAPVPNQLNGKVFSGAQAIGPNDRLIIDLDGTLVRGGAPTAGAARFLARYDGRFAIVSNNSTDTALSLSSVLGRMGLVVAPERLVLAGEEMIHFAARNFPRARCLCVTTHILRRYAARHGLKIVHRDPEVVLLGRDRTMTYQKLSAIANALRRGARLVVANPDVNHPALDGDVVPETGALMRAVVASSGVEPHHIVGKPEPTLFLTALARLKARPADACVVGDNIDTDCAGAERLGMRCILIGEAPRAVAPSLAHFLEMVS
jgi:HAD superfamily hydrolase (TIGR01450 family)